MSLAAAIVAQREQHGIPQAVSCRALGVSQAWFYKWRHGDVSPRRARRASLAAEITRLFKAHDGKYGSPRIAADLKDAGWEVSQNTVAKLMAEQHLVARRKKKRKATTRPGKGRWRAPDLVGRDFSAGQVNKKWFGDGTEIRTAEGKLYLAILWNLACHDCPFLACRTSMMGSRVAVAGSAICRGVPPDGVGMSASRPSRESSAACPSSTAASFVVGERDGCEHALEVVLGFQQLGLAGVLGDVEVASCARHPVRALLEEGVGAVAVAEVVVLPGLPVRGGAGGDGVPVEQDLDGADVAGEVPGLGIGL